MIIDKTIRTLGLLESDGTVFDNKDIDEIKSTIIRLADTYVSANGYLKDIASTGEYICPCCICQKEYICNNSFRQSGVKCNNFELSGLSDKAVE